MGHRITVLHKGDIMQVGTPLDLYEDPANLFTARFIGTPPMNVLDGTITNTGDKIETHGLSLPLEGDLATLGKTHRGRNVTMGVRPEHVVGAEDRRDEPGIFEGEVDVVEPLGHEVIAYTRLAGDRIVAKLHPHHIPGIGDRLNLALDHHRIFLFDKETELRLAAS